MDNAAIAAPGSTTEEFRRGEVVLLTLSSPREKFWGVLLSLSVTGVAMRGIPLESFEDLLRQIRADEPTDLTTAFFPLHRVERLTLDLPSGEMPSLADQFAARTGKPADNILKSPGARP